MDIYPLLLIVFPLLEIYALFSLGAHLFIFRAMKQYDELNPNERQFIKLGLHLEIRLVAIASIIAFALAMLSDYLTNTAVPNSLMSLIVFFLTLRFFSNTFNNQYERIQLKRLEGVIIQCYMLLAVFTSTTIVLLFDSGFLNYLPIPPFAYLNLQASDGKLPVWFTLSRLFVYILPDIVYVGFSFYLANFCFLLWGRVFYYALQKRFWWSIQDDIYVLEYFGDSDVDLRNRK